MLGYNPALGKIWTNPAIGLLPRRLGLKTTQHVFGPIFTQHWVIFSLSLRCHAHGPLAKRLMHMVHLSGNTSEVSKSSSDWLNYTGFQRDVCIAFFSFPPGNKDAVAPNPPHERRKPSCLQLWWRTLIRVN